MTWENAGRIENATINENLTDLSGSITYSGTTNSIIENNGLYESELNTSKTSYRHVRSDVPAGSGYVIGIWTVNFPTAKVSKVNIRWTTAAGGSSVPYRRLDWVKVGSTIVQGSIGRHSSVLRNDFIEFDPIVADSVSLRLMARGDGNFGCDKYGNCGGTSGYSYIRLSYITVYTELEVLQFKVQEDGETYRVGGIDIENSPASSKFRIHENGKTYSLATEVPGTVIGSGVFSSMKWKCQDNNEIKGLVLCPNYD